MKKVAIWVAVAVALWALWRWRAAHDMRVPLDLAFKYPLIPVKDLNLVAGGYATVRNGRAYYTGASGQVLGPVTL